ncbi:YebC/PmpR family DNA-binding transcriptional regulator [Candidatus Shapirobacteria bacterium CG09_land_8_20_14_0_10_38_17]|uniref:Probable transcriptional regulatory protein COT63_01690 n=1 Tax=Candidatus Shapirobacteria bacterium CG09_land_8_20_14_0_10_38_17 TaxID=1974884 RepID=A0A2H0WR10_9BACT|nr:MAG: YebC/PmpR family DNA-binding transcriptional regulator [Candidatus Shapirobacteria bacterium CG09_land_8_20_14_0_10_38_17]
MSGHSKWATIKHQKGIKDKARGQIFSKFSKAISVAVAEGGGEENPNKNFKLRLAIEKAKEVNMPKSNIERAIEKGMGGKGKERLISVRFEGYGPGGVGIIIDAVTDNRQRTIQEIKSIFEKGGGSLATPGAVAYNFVSRGQILVKKKEKEEEQILALMDIDGVEDVDKEEGVIKVSTGGKELALVREVILSQNFEIISSSLLMVPQSLFSVENSERMQKIIDFLEQIENHQDVQDVFTNLDTSS